jgi:hypothetical protein
MIIEQFPPPGFQRKHLDLNELKLLTGKKWMYASSGRACLFNILKSNNCKKILIPNYVCKSILTPIQQLNIKYFCYDFDVIDLNASLESIKSLSNKHNIDTILVASMYGNPANLQNIEEYCRINSIFLIDDAAQSFGSKLENRFVGTYGNAGFFSFSPGKPTAAHMGGFFWTDNKVRTPNKNNFLIHYLRWLDFYWNRYKKIKCCYFVGRLLNLSSRIIFKFIKFNNDRLHSFESDILGGVLDGVLKGRFDFRREYGNAFFQKFSKSQTFRIIRSVRGVSNEHKIVLVFNEKKFAAEFILFMKNKKIYTSNGYKFLCKNKLPNMHVFDQRIVELPIVENKNKMNYMFEKVKEYENCYL